MMSTDMDNDLNWLAMRYVLGELSESDRDAFEQRLLGDLAACEAIAAASRMRHGLHATIADSLVHQPSQQIVRSSARSLPAVAAALLCLSVTFVGVGYWLSSPVSNHIAAELVSRWRTGMDASIDDSDTSVDEIDDSNVESEIPEWLIAGVALENQNSSNGHDNEVKDN